MQHAWFWILLTVSWSARAGVQAQEADPVRGPASAAGRVWPGVPPGIPDGVWVENRGQWPEHVRFVARMPGGLARAEQGSIAVQLADASGKGTLTRFVLPAGSADWSLQGASPIEAKCHFYIGNDPSRWQCNVRGFEALYLEDAALGERFTVRAVAGVVCLDWAPDAVGGGAALLIRADDGCDPALGPCGHARVETVAGSGVDGSAHARLIARGQAASTMSRGDGTQAATAADPSLLWSTYMGGGGDDSVMTVAVEPSGNVVVGGGTYSAGFPTTSGAFQAPNGFSNCFAAKIRSEVGTLMYSAVFGGYDQYARAQVPLDSAIDALGRPVFAGKTHARNFPTTPGAFIPEKVSPWNAEGGFVTQLSADGSQLVFSTYLEGPRQGSALLAVDVGNDGAVYVAGAANSDFPVSPNAFQNEIPPNQYGSGFVCKLSPNGTGLEWSTFLGGSQGDAVYGMVVRATEVIVGGITYSGDFPTTPGAFKERHGWAPYSAVIFLSSVIESGTALKWSTYLSGTSPGEQDHFGGLDVDLHGNVVVCGSHNTWNPSPTSTFPTTPGSFRPRWPPGAVSQGFLLSLDPNTQSLRYSTFYGSATHGGLGYVQLDTSGVPLLISSAASQRIPLTPGAFDTMLHGDNDALVLRFSPNADRLFYGTVLGGPHGDTCRGVAALPTGRTTSVFIIGMPGGFPTTANALQPNFNGGQHDGAVATLDLFLKGLLPLGASAPSCLGPLHLNGTEMPVEGASTFGLWCSGAPPNASGTLLVGDLLSQPMPWNGIELWIDPASASQSIPYPSDDSGYAEVAFPLGTGTQGAEWGAQAIFPATPTCTTSTTWSSSQALRIVVQSAP